MPRPTVRQLQITRDFYSLPGTTRLQPKRSVSPTFFDTIPKGAFDTDSNIESDSTTLTDSDDEDDKFSPPADYEPQMTSSWSSATTILVQSTMKFRVRKACRTIRDKFQGKEHFDAFADNL